MAAITIVILAWMCLLCNFASALVSGVDSSQLVSEASFKKAKAEGFTKAIIRAYVEACGVGGKVDPNFIPSYKNARAAGFADIDVYWFPCNGSGNKCKPYAAQLSELRATLNGNDVNVGTIWVDIEKDAGVCNNWNYGTAGNQAQAQSLIASIRASGMKYGIYSSPGEWSSIFGSPSFVLDSSAPLWFATYDNVKTTQLSKPFGGWTIAVGHQYTNVSPSGLFNLNVFA